MDIQKSKESIPFKVEAYEKELLETRAEIKKFVKLSEGLVFGKIGLDAGIGLIPVVGGLYTGIVGIWLLIQANKVRSGLQEKFFIFILTLVDIILGLFVFPGVGDILDAFFRVHAWNGDRLIAHIDYQLLLIARVREQISKGIHSDLNALEDVLFRKGKTKEEQTQIQIAIAVVIIIIFVGCAAL